MKSAADLNEVLKRLRRGTVECHTEEDLRKKLASGRKLRIKLGVDPTSPDLHLGHTVVLNRLRAFQDEGHTAVLIIGDYTARIGDPSGRDTTRPALNEQRIQANAATYRAQAFKVLDPNKTELRFNSEWLETFVREALFSQLQKFTISQLMQRDDFAKRSTNNIPITLLEILYPIFQGYDSVAVRSDVELGGNDQLFNLLMGRQMQKDAGQEPQVALTLPLLVGLDGVKKMSKSYENAISLTDGARDMFGKVMSVTDKQMYDYYLLLTNKDIAEIRALHPMQAKKDLAQLITARYHGEEAARNERGFFDETFSKKKEPTDVPVRDVEAPEKNWSQLLVKLGLVESRKEAQRLISQGGFKVDGQAVREDALGKPDGERLLQIGKYKFCKVRFQ